MNPFGKGRMEAIRSLTMINIESLLLAVLAGLTLLDQGRPAWLALAAGAALLLLLRLVFRFRIGYWLISAGFSVFWAWCFSNGWFTDGNFLMGGLVALVMFAACLYGHKISYQDQQNHQEE